MGGGEEARKHREKKTKKEEWERERLEGDKVIERGRKERGI